MLPDYPSARTSSVCATRIITTPGVRSSTRPFMCTMPIHRAVDRVDGGSGGGGSGGASGGFASISAAEYFVDTDPGAGSGIAFQAKDGAFDSEVESILPKDLNVTGLSVGPHLVGVAIRIITTPGARSSTRPFMCTMPIQTSMTEVVEDREARADLL